MASASTMVIPSNPSDQKVIFLAIKEASDCMLRAESEREQIKAIKEDIAEKFPDISKKHIGALIKVYHKQNLSVIEQENNDLVELYNSVVK